MKQQFRGYQKSVKRRLCRFGCLLAILGLLLFGSATAGTVMGAGAQPLASRTGFFFDTVITISLYDTDDETILDDCFARMDYYESIFSRTREGSDIWKINHAEGKPVTVAEETADIISQALHYCALSQGAFDITIAPVVDLWDFHEDAQAVLPDGDAISRALPHVDYRQVKVLGDQVTLTDPQAQIDLGAVAKGYISDGAAALLRERGVKSALIDLGGNIYAVGNKPDGTPFRIGVRRPFGESAMDLIAVVEAADGVVITSGTYERYFILEGTLYHHILDTTTGYSLQNGLTSVTIKAPRGTDGDALSTTCFALGLERGMELIESLDGIEAMFVDEQEHTYPSSGWE